MIQILWRLFVAIKQFNGAENSVGVQSVKFNILGSLSYFKSDQVEY